MTGKLADAIHLHLYVHERVPRHRRSTIALLVAVTGAGLGLPAYALSGQEDPDGQLDPPAAVQAEARQDQVRSLDTVSVTASRAARRLGGTAPTPTTMVGAEELSDTNVSVVADHLNRLPAFRGVTTPATTSHSSQNAGANFLNLRGLGNNRTLVLVNGYRHVPTTTSGLLDTNVLPSKIIDRVEVVTGGASAAWGSDAVAGVVNLILRNEIDGVEGSIKYGATERGDGNDVNISLAAGTQFGGGRGRFLVAGEYTDNNGVGADRGWFREHHGVVANPAYVPGGSEPRNLIVPDLRVSTATLGGLITSGPLRGLQFEPGGGTSEFQYGQYAGTQYMSGGDGIYPGDLISLVTPVERGSVYTRTRFDVTDSTTVFMDVSRAFSRTMYAMSTSYDLGSITIHRDNAFLPSEVGQQMDDNGIDQFNMGRIHHDIGFNTVSNKNVATRIAAGVEGMFGDYSSWDAFVTYGKNTYDARILNNRIRDNFNLAVDAVLAQDGSAVCRSTLDDPGNGCVPVNLFGYGSPSAEAIRYLTGVQSLTSDIDQKSAAANIRGEPFSTWAGPVSAAAGLEYREESVDQRVDAMSEAGLFSIGNPKALSGSYSVREAYVEAIVPLAEDTSFAQSINLDLGLRVADYSESGMAKPWKIGLAYDVNPDWRLRLTRSRDIRAPNISEMYAGYLLTFSTINDPLTGTQLIVRQPQVGNTDLQPESANTLTAGVVFQPEWAPGLQLSLDYYDIDLSGAIATLPAQAMVDRCASGNQALCEFVERGEGGNLVEVRRSFINLSSIRTNGVDAEVNYAVPAGTWNVAGDLQFRLLASYVNEFVSDDGVNSVDQSDVVGSGGSGGPHWRGVLSASYQHDPWRVYVEGRYVGSGIYDAELTYNRNRVSSQFLVNSSIRYAIVESRSARVEIFGGIDNLFDRDPPIAPYQFLFGSPANAAAHDILGRRYTVGVNFAF